MTFRQRRLLPTGHAPGRVEGLRFWKALSTGADPFLSMPPDVSRRRLLKPNLREWGFFAIWETEADVDRFLAGSPIADMWRDESTETWSVWLKPTYSRGEWAGVRILQDVEQNALPPAPAALLTRLDLPVAALAAFWLSAAPSVAPRVPSVEGLLAGVPLMDRPYVQPMTFTIWRSLDDALSFAYRGAFHPGGVERLREARKDIVSKFSRARFYPHRSEGTWKGENPLAEADALATAIHAEKRADADARSASSDEKVVRAYAAVHSLSPEPT